MSTAPEPSPLRPPDLAESAEAVAALRAGKQYALLIATEHMTRLSVGWRPPTDRQARLHSDWGLPVGCMRNLCGIPRFCAATLTSMSILIVMDIAVIASILSAQVADWVAARAVAIDRASGQVGRAAELLAQGGTSDQTVDVQQLQSVLGKGVDTNSALPGPAFTQSRIPIIQSSAKLDVPT